MIEDCVCLIVVLYIQPLPPYFQSCRRCREHIEVKRLCGDQTKHALHPRHLKGVVVVHANAHTPTHPHIVLKWFQRDLTRTRPAAHPHYIVVCVTASPNTTWQADSLDWDLLVVVVPNPPSYFLSIVPEILPGKDSYPVQIY
jgi:hypothetical protein